MNGVEWVNVGKFVYFGKFNYKKDPKIERIGPATNYETEE
jgi:hypothetical protein